MPSTASQAVRALQTAVAGRPTRDLLAALHAKDTPLPPQVRGADDLSADAIAARWALVRDASGAAEIAPPTALPTAADYARNIEYFIGTVQVPVGLAGPLRVNGLAAQGDYYVPLATTEAALVASYHRGCMLVSAAGGGSAMITARGITRSPGFVFRDLIGAGTFVQWILSQREAIGRIAASTSRHLALRDVRVTIDGNHVYLLLDAVTGDASGQNMVTIAAQAIGDWIVANSPVTPESWVIEANHSGDKKASALAFLGGRGRSVIADVEIPARLLAERLRVTPKQMQDYWALASTGGVLSGTMGCQGHYANGLAALYLATGQDIACVSESAVGVTRFEDRGDSLYASVTLPSVLVATVGGGTALPTQQGCLRALGVAQTGGADVLAEVAAVLVLAGELSIVGAIVAHEFTRAHHRLARTRGGAV